MAIKTRIILAIPCILIGFLTFAISQALASVTLQTGTSWSQTFDGTSYYAIVSGGQADGAVGLQTISLKNGATVLHSTKKSTAATSDPYTLVWGGIPSATTSTMSLTITAGTLANTNTIIYKEEIASSSGGGGGTSTILINQIGINTDMEKIASSTCSIAGASTTCNYNYSSSTQSIYTIGNMYAIGLVLFLIGIIVWSSLTRKLHE